MLKIGDVSRLTGVPIKTIRYWEEFGLIKPAFVDEYTGYRQYDEGNIERLSQIVYLKSLGFELKEILHLDEKVIAEKTRALKDEIMHLYASISSLSSMRRNNKGEIEMKNFVNDKNAIGHWTLLGGADTKEDAKALKLHKLEDFAIKDLYLMEGGKQYWIIGWTKGKIFINNRHQKYQIFGDHMIVEISYDDEPAFYAVFKRVDSVCHVEKDFMIVDNIDMPFVLDGKAVGIWQGVDFVRKPNQFKPGKRFWKDTIFMHQLSFMPNGELFVEFGKRAPEKQHWTKSHILFKSGSGDTNMKYDIFTIDGQDYMSMEWKSGDYTYGGQVRGYYILKRI